MLSGQKQKIFIQYSKFIPYRKEGYCNSLTDPFVIVDRLRNLIHNLHTTDTAQTITHSDSGKVKKFTAKCKRAPDTCKLHYDGYACVCVWCVCVCVCVCV